MKLKFTIFTMIAFVVLFTGCSKDEFNERDAIEAQKDLLNLKYQHELDLETLKQKGATALQQLMNTAALEQLKLNDSLATKGAIELKKKDYSVTVVDVYSNTPIADADVTVSSQGKIYAAKSNAQGVATFSSLYLFPTSTFLISKAGYAATQLLEQNITMGNAQLWNVSDLSNEVSGTLYIDTDLTNQTTEKVGANVLVTAAATIPSSPTGSYTVYFPAYTDAGGMYTIKVPAAPNGYTLSFEQIAADQKLYVNATQDDAVPSFPNSLPRLTTIKTYFNVNSYGAPVPFVNNYYYFKVTADKGGKVLYLPGYSNNYGYNQVLLSSSGGSYHIERLNTYNYNYSIDINAYSYDPNTKVDVEMIDVAGNIIQTAPLLSASVDANGKLAFTNSPEGGSGYIHLKRDDAGNLVANAKGNLLRANIYDTYYNLYTLNFANSMNSTSSRAVNTTFLLNNKGDKKVINYYYGSGDSRVREVY